MVDSIQNISKLDEDKKEKIANLGIYELRGVARALGVPSPTTKKREFLVEAILDILSKDNIELPQTATKGRPFKKLESIDSILGLLGDSNIKSIEIQKSFSYEDIVSFAQEIPVFEYHSDEAIRKAGVLRLTRKSSYFIDMGDESIVFVSNEILENTDLQNGDLIEGIAYKINQNNQYYLKEVLKINNCFIKNYVCNVQPMREKVLPRKSVDLVGVKIYCGVRNVQIIENPLFLETTNIELLSEMNYLFKNSVFIGLDMCSDDQLLLKEFNNMVKFTTTYGNDNIQRNFDKIIDVINYCERIIKSGDSAVLIVYDLIKILTTLDKYFSNFEGCQLNWQHYQQSIIIIEKMLSLASAYSNNNDFTTYIIGNKVDLEDAFMKNDVLKISKIIK